MGTRSCILRFAACVAAAAVAACSGSGTGPDAHVVRLERDFTLAPGDQAVVARSGLRVDFVGVSEDARCPIESFCLLPGNAAVDVRLTTRFDWTVSFVLNTFEEPREVCFASHGLRLVSLEPQPSVHEPIPPDGYRATFRVATATCLQTADP